MCLLVGVNMKTYKVTIEEMVSQDFDVPANDIYEALQIAEEKYRKDEFVLAPGNLVCKQIAASCDDGDCVDWYEF